MTLTESDMHTFLLFFDLGRAFNRLMHKLDEWFNAIIAATPNFILSIFIFLFFLFVSKLLTRFSSKLIKRITDNESVNQLLSWFIYFFTLCLGLFASLNILGLDKTVTSLLTGAGILGLAVSFAFQNNASNFIAGVLIAMRKHYDLNDWIKVREFYGKVVKITVNYTIIQAENGEYVTLPNRMLVENAFTNYSKYEMKEIELHVNIGLHEDLDRVRKLTRETIKGLNRRLTNKPIEVNFMNFKDFAIELEIAFWIPFSDHKHAENARSEAIMAIMKTFKANNIEVQIPQYQRIKP